MTEVTFEQRAAGQEESSCCNASVHDHCSVHFHTGANSCGRWCSKCYNVLTYGLDDEGRYKPVKHESAEDKAYKRGFEDGKVIRDLKGDDA